MDPAGKRPRIVRREAAGESDNSAARGYLDGQLLIAMPVMGDPRFERSVIYLCAHSAEGAMGIIVNRPAGSIDFPELLVQLDIIKKVDQIKLPENAETPAAASCCIRAISSSRMRRCGSTTESA
jgi:putative transcriptional regulator